MKAPKCSTLEDLMRQNRFVRFPECQVRAELKFPTKPANDLRCISHTKTFIGRNIHRWKTQAGEFAASSDSSIKDEQLRNAIDAAAQMMGASVPDELAQDLFDQIKMALTPSNETSSAEITQSWVGFQFTKAFDREQSAENNEIVNQVALQGLLAMQVDLVEPFFGFKFQSDGPSYVFSERPDGTGAMLRQLSHTSVTVTESADIEFSLTLRQAGHARSQNDDPCQQLDNDLQENQMHGQVVRVASEIFNFLKSNTLCRKLNLSFRTNVGVRNIPFNVVPSQ